MCVCVCRVYDYIRIFVNVFPNKVKLKVKSRPKDHPPGMVSDMKQFRIFIEFLCTDVDWCSMLHGYLSLQNGVMLTG